ncbi:type-4 ice-structuring protein [Fundulus heteroclitus]|uniref:type-4 ice-structuring protein n=1 Tax=Fundulus heteroclitus TaxID=8078 RepID=UPI00165C68E8|nr:type-4 ice-structuring protein [Fundulus heteroclitus]
MKLFLIAALLVLALTHGSSAEQTGAQLTQYLENIKAKINRDLQDFMDQSSLKDHAETFLENRQAAFEPVAVKIQSQLEDMKAAAGDMEDQIKPLADNVKEKVNPLIANLQEKMETIMQMLAEHAKTAHK